MDRMFPLASVGLPLRDQLMQAAYPVELYVGGLDEHIPKGWQDHWVPKWLAMASSPAGVGVGCAVRVVGLTKATHLNDKVGRVHDFDEEKLRYIVALGCDHGVVAVRLENLQACAPFAQQ